MGWSGPAPALPAIEVCQGRKDKERALAEKGECSFRTASIDAGEMTLWVIRYRIRLVSASRDVRSFPKADIRFQRSIWRDGPN
jgi:hypothetical protein